MTTPEELDELLGEMGYPPRERVDLSEWGYLQTSGAYADWGEAFRLFDPLLDRAWLVHFDAEGQFFVEGEHAKLIEALLTVAGVDPLPDVSDSFEPEDCWTFEIAGKERKARAVLQTVRLRPSDYAETDAVCALVSGYLGGQRVVSLATGDQTACLCVMPDDVYLELVQREWLVDCGRRWEPSPDELLAENVERRPPGVSVEVTD